MQPLRGSTVAWVDCFHIGLASMRMKVIVRATALERVERSVFKDACFTLPKAAGTECVCLLPQEAHVPWALRFTYIFRIHGDEKMTFLFKRVCVRAYMCVCSRERQRAPDNVSHQCVTAGQLFGLAGPYSNTLAKHGSHAFRVFRVTTARCFGRTQCFGWALRTIVAMGGTVRPSRCWGD